MQICNAIMHLVKCRYVHLKFTIVKIINRVQKYKMNHYGNFYDNNSN